MPADLEHGYRFDGARAGFLLLHEPGGSPSELHDLAKSLSQAGFTVHVPRLGVGSATADAGLALTEMRGACDAVIVGGHSMAAALALELAIERERDVAGLALLSPALWLDRRSEYSFARALKFVFHPWGRVSMFLPKLGLNGLIDRRRRDLAARVQTSRPLPTGDVRRDVRERVRNLEGKLGKIRQPTIVLHAGRDCRVPSLNMDLLKLRLGGSVEAVALDERSRLLSADSHGALAVGRLIRFGCRLAQRGGIPLTASLTGVAAVALRNIA